MTDAIQHYLSCLPVLINSALWLFLNHHEEEELQVILFSIFSFDS